MRIVFGIGNPGPRYDGTRHNLGFRVVDALAAAAGRPLLDLAGVPAVGASIDLDDAEVLLVKPLTYVNRCGPVLAALRTRGEVEDEHLLVVVDDLNLPVGRLRLRPRGSDGGHNGLRSLIDHLQTHEFPRLRIGIGDPGGLPAERYVLEPFPPEEREAIDAAVAGGADAVRSWARLDIERAMAEVNRRDLDQPEDRA